MNRRTFLTASAAATATGFFTGHGRAQTPSPNSKLGHACIGVGGMGAGDLNSLKSHPDIQITAICDVDKNKLANAAKKVPDARTYTDWRELMASEGDNIDSVNVATPDHMHAAITVSAIRSGKNVYCQKPLCKNIAEIVTVMEETKRSKRVTQLGTQYAAMVGDRMAVQYLKQGALGEVQRVVQFLTSKSLNRIPGPRPEKGSPVPNYLEWDLWLGTAPARDYAPDIYHPRKWRAWQDFGTGLMGDNQSHLFDSSWKGLGLTAPISVKAEVQESWITATARRSDNWPQSQHVTWTFPGNDKTGGKNITVEWFDGEMKPPAEYQKYAEEAGLSQLPNVGSLVIGSEGAMLMAHGTAPRLVSKNGNLKNYPKPKLEPHPTQYHHYIDACLGKAKTESHFLQTGPMTIAIMLGNYAVRFPNQELQWDAANMKVTNVPEANALIGRKYRQGWNIPGLG